MHLPSQTERPLFIATRTLWGLLCPSLLLLLCSLSRVPRTQKTWTRPFLRYVQIQLPPFTTITMNNPSSFIHYFNFFRSFFLVIKVGQSVLRKWKAEPQHLRFLHQACRGGGMYKGGGPLAPSKFWNFFKYIYNYFNIFKF